MLSSRIYPWMPQFNTELVIRANADTLQENLRGKDLLGHSAKKAKNRHIAGLEGRASCAVRVRPRADPPLLSVLRFQRLHPSRALRNFTLSREVSFGGKRMLLAATFPDSTHSIR